MFNGNLSDILEKAEAERFVGREREIKGFRHYVNLTPPTYLIFNITGQGGVGKTTLLNRFKAIARRELNMLVASCSADGKIRASSK